MKVLKPFIVIFLALQFCSLFGQSFEIFVISFHYKHSRRIPDNNVFVTLERSGNEPVVFVKSLPMDTTSAKWKNTKQEYSFSITLPEFEKIVSSVKKINCTDVSNGLDLGGFDGSQCKIEIEGLSSSIAYKIWAPTYKTKERNLEEFLEACKQILVIAKLDPDNIL